MNKERNDENGIQLVELTEDVLGEVVGGEILVCQSNTYTTYQTPCGSHIKCDPAGS
jgi:hypothetical protein